MGGLVPLGYDARDRSLVINEAEAETVRTLFRLYLDLGCVRCVKEEADRRGLLSKHRRLESGKTYGGIPVNRLREMADKQLNSGAKPRRILPEAQENQPKSLLISLLAGNPNRKIAERRRPRQFRRFGQAETVSATRVGR